MSDTVPLDDGGLAAAFRARAEQGDAQAQFDLGTFLEHGRGVERDPAEALAWYRRAAEQGYGPAQNQKYVLLTTPIAPQA